ncbi:MAG: hypothetical protein ACD_62C00555G0001 [uncultured bacterium]|nr:MAG: hypothetical protein ACD_62C00555G0001 [uncultured bacterium]
MSPHGDFIAVPQDKQGMVCSQDIPALFKRNPCVIFEQPRRSGINVSKQGAVFQSQDICASIPPCHRHELATHHFSGLHLHTCCIIWPLRLDHCNTCLCGFKGPYTSRRRGWHKFFHLARFGLFGQGRSNGSNRLFKSEPHHPEFGLNIERK